MHRHALRALALVTAPLVATVLVAVPAEAAADPTPTSAAGTWLTGQLTDGIVHNAEYDFDDIGLTIDVALALKAVGASGVQEISDAVAPRVTGYVAPGYGTNLSAGGAAKALVLAEAAGADPTSYGGRDLVADVESRVSESGRIQDDWDASDPYGADYANTFGQAFAVQGLDAVGSAKTDAVTDFLLEQQCPGGYFRQDFDESCDGGSSVDATAAALVGLQSQVDDTDVASHVAAAVSWLLERQKGNGGFGSNADIATANANSTGAAGYALLLSSRDRAAARAAAWLRAHQLANVARCSSVDADDAGAVVYDNQARKSAHAAPMDAALNDQTVRATAEALPGLLAAPRASNTPRTVVRSGHVRVGRSLPVAVRGAAPGEPLCAMLGGQSVLGWADPAGDAKLRVRPAASGVHVLRVAGGAGTIGKARLHVNTR